MELGITVAGNLLVDHVKIIDTYPDKGMLCNVYESSMCVGGCVCNTAIDLAILDCEVPIYSVGKIGSDSDGRYIKQILEGYNISTEGIHMTDEYPTSFSDVMTVRGTGERTFFHYRGANSDLQYEDVLSRLTTTSIFHIGYPLLLDKLDMEDIEYGTQMAKLLHRIQEKGIKTSMDTVSDSTGKFKKVIIPSLKYCNYLIVNEIEAGNLVEIEARSQNRVIENDTMKSICEKVLDLGVKDLVVIHAPEGGWAMDKNRTFWQVDSLKLPKDYIKGTVGAGDAFCAGILYGIYKERSIEQCLKLAVAAAACNLAHSNSIEGMKSVTEVEKIYQTYK